LPGRQTALVRPRPWDCSCGPDLARIEIEIHNAILDLVSKRRTYDLPDVAGSGTRPEP